jgi:hypothetical protein
MTDIVITPSGSSIWLNVTDKAEQVFKSGAFKLFHVWRVDGTTHRAPINTEYDLRVVLDIVGDIKHSNSICIDITENVDAGSVEFVTLPSWEAADKIQHNGYIYVRYTDLLLCK